MRLKLVWLLIVGSLALTAGSVIQDQTYNVSPGMLLAVAAVIIVAMGSDKS